MSLGVTAWSVLCSAGVGREPFIAALASRDARPTPAPNVQGLYDAPLPWSTAHALVDLDVRQILGRKRTSSLDRRTALALIACRDVLRRGGVRIDDETRHRIGVTLGTTWGSLQAMSDYTKDSLLEERPYLVEPSRFPNTVMNCAAGQAAIWFGLTGVNATIAGGGVGFFNVMQYTANVLRCGYADTMLAGAVEEFTPHAAWAHYAMPRGHAPVMPGEASVVFLIERPAEARAAGRCVEAELLSIATGFAAEGASGRDVTGALAACIRRALASARLAPHAISLVVTSETSDEADRTEADAVSAVCGTTAPERIAARQLFGECQAATGALQVAAVLAWHRSGSRPDGAVSLLTGATADGGLGAAVLKGWNSGGAHHR